MIFKIVAAALAAALISALLKDTAGEFVPLIRIAGAAVIILMVFKLGHEKLSDFFSYIGQLHGAKEALTLLLKGALVCTAAKITSDICRENGSASAAAAVELAARILTLILCLPIIETALKAALAFVD